MLKKYKRSFLVIILVFLLTFTGFSQTGPGGVGNATTNVLWLDANRGITLTGTNVTNWADQSGNTFNAIPPNTVARPTIINASVNGYPSIDFDGTNDQLRITDAAAFDLTQWDIFIVPIVNLAKNFNAWLVKGRDGAENYEVLSYADNRIHTPIQFTTGARTFPSSPAGQLSTTDFTIIEYSYATGTGRDIYRNNTSIYSDNENRTPRTNNFDLAIGNEQATSGRFINGGLAEVLMYNTPLNSAERIIVNNYLAAKYNRPLTTADIYNEDDAANGNFDHEVAGIGRVDATNLHTDAQGTGIVRVSDPINLDNDEFLLWGHDNGNLTLSNTTDIPTTQTLSRFGRIWRVSEVNVSGTPVDVGAVDIRVDMTGITGFSDAFPPQLLIDTDNDGLFNDETPITTATSLGSNQYRFNGVAALVNNARFTFALGRKIIITNKRITYRVDKN